MLSVTWFVQDDHERMSSALEDLGAVATRLDNRFFLAWYHCALGYSALHRGQLDTARSELEASLDDCRSAGEPVTDSIANAYLAELELLTGEYDAARERLEALLAHASAAGGAIGVPLALVELVNLTLACGDAVAARDLADPLVDAGTRRGGHPVLSRVRALRARSRLARDR